MNREEKIKNLAECLSSGVVTNILDQLVKYFDTKKELAEMIGCSYPTVKKWTQGHTPGKKYLPKILSIAFQYAPETKKIIAQEILKIQILTR